MDLTRLTAIALPQVRCMHNRVFLIIPSALLATSASSAFAQAYPSKPIRMVTAEAGGATDLVARLVAREISGPLGQQIIVDNRNALTSGDIVSRSQRDGYTVLVQSSVHWISPLMQSTYYDPVRDFAPITLIDRAPNILVVHPAVSARSVREVVALAKAKPGTLNYGTAGSGTANHLAAELFRTMADIKVVHIPYRGTAQSIADLLAGRIHMMIANAGAAAPHVKAGKLVALAVTSAQTSALYPELPTVTASGVSGYASESVHAVLAPAGTAAAVIDKLHREIVTALKTPQAKERFLGAGLEVAGSSPAELASLMKADIARLGKVIKDAGIRAE